MFDRLKDRAERIGIDAVDQARRRIMAELDEPGVSVAASEQGVTLRGLQVGERLWWIGGLFR
jgi:hypothetical protein